MASSSSFISFIYLCYGEYLYIYHIFIFVLTENTVDQNTKYRHFQSKNLCLICLYITRRSPLSI